MCYYYAITTIYIFTCECDQIIGGEIITGFNDFEIVYSDEYYHFHIKRKVMTFGYTNSGEFETWGSR